MRKPQEQQPQQQNSPPLPKCEKCKRIVLQCKCAHNEVKK